MRPVTSPVSSAPVPLSSLFISMYELLCARPCNDKISGDHCFNLSLQLYSLMIVAERASLIRV